MDCLSIPDSAEYNCSNRWGVNCTSHIGFQFDEMWSITQRIQRYCPSDPRLYLGGSGPATPKNAALTGRACKAIAGETWQYYPADNIWERLTTWKFPLLQLVASSPRPPLGFAVESFAIVHLLGDPVGTIKDLLRVISNCQQRANFWRAELDRHRSNRLQSTLAQANHAWKAFSIISISFDEWGKGDEVQKILKDTLDSFTESEESEDELKTFLRLTHLTADALAADRATKFLPILVAQAFFIGTIAVAITKITSVNPVPANVYINVEAHSIAFSALYFYILPAVFLTSIIGVSQTQNAVPRILRRLQTGFELELHPTGRDILIRLPTDVLDEAWARRVRGGIYSWQPNQLVQHTLKRPPAMLRVMPSLLLIACGATAMLISGFVPPDGWEMRHCGEAALLLTWLVSHVATGVLKRYTRSHSHSGFWLTLAKDALVTVATMGGIVVTQVGVFNCCDSVTRWDRTGLALPEMPDVAAVLALRIRTLYPAIAFAGIALQITVVPVVVAVWYRHALMVFLQRDDENAGFGQLGGLGEDTGPPPRRRDLSSRDEEIGTIAVSKEGTRLEHAELIAKGQKGRAM